MIRLKNLIFLVCFAVLIMAGCAKKAPEFSSYVKPDVDYSQFKSYRWQSDKPETAIMQAQRDIVHQFIVQTTEEELAADGLEKKDDADLVVSYRVTVSPQKSFWQTFFGAEGITPGTYNQRSAEAQATSADEHKHRQGVLVIELADRTGSVIWAGRARLVLTKEQPGIAVGVVRKIMEEYPPEG